MVIVLSFLNHGFILLFHGDMILDERGQLRVLSGDTIAPILASRLPHCERLVFVSAHAVHRLDPREHPESPVLCELSRSDQVSLGNDNHDVSGAMAGKIETIRRLCKPDLVVVISPPQHVLAAVRGSLPNAQVTVVH